MMRLPSARKMVATEKSSLRVVTKGSRCLWAFSWRAQQGDGVVL
jgi:hypothetical protein